MHEQKKINEPRYRKYRIILITIAALLCYRYSYFVFVSPLNSLPNCLEKRSENSKIRTTVTKKINLEQTNDPTKAVEIGDNGQFIYSFTSKKHNWQRTFDDYYYGGGIIVRNDKYLVLRFRRGPEWSDSLYGPSIFIYLQVNTAKIPYRDIFVLDRTTGNTVKRYRYHEDISLDDAYYDETSKAFHFVIDEKCHYLKLD